MSDSNSKNGGVGVLGLMFIVFLTLKLTDYIDWSWWWVTAPLWLPAVSVMSIGLIAIVIGYALKAIRKNKK